MMVNYSAVLLVKAKKGINFLENYQALLQTQVTLSVYKTGLL